MRKLLICGDVESNPVPTTEEMFAQILIAQDTIRTEIADIKAHQSKTERMISDLDKKFNDMDKLLQELGVKSYKIDALERALTSLESTIYIQKWKISDLEDLSRHSNLLVYGIPEAPEEQLRSKVISDVLVSKLGVVFIDR